MEFYRNIGGNADSAGTKVDQPGEKLAQRTGALTIVDIMREDYDIDMNENTRTQLDRALAQKYDNLVVMAEKHTMPEWLAADERTVYWAVEDPKGLDAETVRRIVGEIKRRVEALSV